MGFNRHKLDADRKAKADAEAAAQRATDPQVRLIAAWNERQAKRMPMLFSPTIGAAIAARHWFLWVRCPACGTIRDAPFAELVRLSKTSIADEMRIEHRRRVLGE